MSERKLTAGSFEKGPLRKILNKQMRSANLSPKSMKRVEEALKAGTTLAAKKHGLQYGVGAKYFDDLSKYPTSQKFVGRLDPNRRLTEKDQKVLDTSLNLFFKRKPAAAPKLEVKPKPPPPRPAPPLRPPPPPKEEN